MINQYKAGWRRKLLRESWTEGTNRFCEKESAHDTTWQGCTGFNFKHVTTSSTLYYRLSHILVKNMLIQMWSKCEVTGDQGKVESIISRIESWVIYKWFFHQTPKAISLGSHVEIDTWRHTQSSLPTATTRECGFFLTQKASQLIMTHVGGKLCGFIHYNNVQYMVLFVTYTALKWQFDNPPCKKHQDAQSSFCIHFSIERCKEFCHGS
jgi:hypothetical protein